MISIDDNNPMPNNITSIFQPMNTTDIYASEQDTING